MGNLKPSVALTTAIARIGSQSALARLIGVAQQSVSAWVLSGKRLPAEHVLVVEAATGVSRHDLRPDIYPVEPRDTSRTASEEEQGAMAAARLIPYAGTAGIPDDAGIPNDKASPSGREGRAPAAAVPKAAAGANTKEGRPHKAGPTRDPTG
ncbi:MAG: YdaS family helix-turn-helix protein [Novosphingobium sp.]